MIEVLKATSYNGYHPPFVQVWDTQLPTCNVSCYAIDRYDYIDAERKENEHSYNYHSLRRDENLL